MLRRLCVFVRITDSDMQYRQSIEVSELLVLHSTMHYMNYQFTLTVNPTVNR